jgi:hemerythrin-like metal-binding protein
MAIITWEKDYSVGVAELDEQHKKLIAIINNLFSLYAENKFSDVDVEPIFQELTDYADQHFTTEEYYFKLYNYDKKDAHIALHNAYRKKLEELKNFYDKNTNADTLFAINNFLNDWWIWHINHVDKEYTAYFNANGLK